MCPFQSKRLCSASCGVWEEEGVLDTMAVCSGELQELVVQSLLSSVHGRASLPCLSAYSEMGTEEEPALKTSLVVSQLLWRRTHFLLKSECLSP